MQNTGRMVGAPGCKFRKVTVPECWLLVGVGLTPKCFECMKITTPECWLLVGMVIYMDLQLGALHNPPTLLPIHSNHFGTENAWHEQYFGMPNIHVWLAFMCKYEC